MKKFLSILLSLLFVVCLIPTGQAQAAGAPYVERAVVINDNQIVVEFSEPVKFTPKTGTYGPFMAVRYLDPNNATQVGAPNKEGVWQWASNWEFIDEDCDRVLLNVDIYQIFDTTENIEEIAMFKGEHWVMGLYQCKLFIEEVPLETQDGEGDPYHSNITSLDGTRHMETNVSYGPMWATTVVDLTFDYDYKLLRDNKEPEENGGMGLNGTVDKDQTPGSESKPTTPGSTPAGSDDDLNLIQNDTNWALIIGIAAGAAVLIAAVVILLVVAKKKKKGA